MRVRVRQDPEAALTLFKRIAESHPALPTAQYGIAKTLDRLADLNRNNQLLKHAIDEYERYFDMTNIQNNAEFEMAAVRCIERMRFIGKSICSTRNK